MRILFFLNSKIEIQLIPWVQNYFKKKGSTEHTLDYYVLDEWLDFFSNDIFQEKFSNMEQILINYETNQPLSNNIYYKAHNERKVNSKRKLEEISNKLSDYDLYCFSSYQRYLEEHLLISLQIKRNNPKARFLFGGPEIITNEKTRLLLRVLDFDYSFHDVDASIFDYIHDYENFYTKKHFSYMKDLTFEDVPLYTKRELEFVDYNLSISTFKGCANHCKFCSNPIPGHLDSLPRPVLVDWIKYYNSIGIKEVLFSDASFNKVGFDYFLDQMIMNRNKIKFNKMTCLELQSMNIDNASKVKQAGFDNVFFGIECMSKENQIAMNKVMPSYEETYNIIKTIANNDSMVILSTIYNFPDQSIESFAEETEFLYRLQIDFPHHVKIHFNTFYLCEGSYCYNNLDSYNVEKNYFEYSNHPALKKYEGFFVGLLNVQESKARIDKGLFDRMTKSIDLKFFFNSENSLR